MKQLNGKVKPTLPRPIISQPVAWSGSKGYLDRLEFVYTPKHGSWLDMAEIELSILQRDCLNRHIATKELLETEISAWQTKRNAKRAKANWQFTTKDARIKLYKLYPTA